MLKQTLVVVGISFCLSSHAAKWVEIIGPEIPTTPKYYYDADSIKRTGNQATVVTVFSWPTQDPLESKILL